LGQDVAFELGGVGSLWMGSVPFEGADASGDYYDQMTIAVTGDAYKVLRDHITSQGTCDAPTA
jgi:hypothetical protein